ncbi:MAG: hypothetical protein CMJ09_02755 [Pelagibacterales bacterium]|nr:hypothetical protein [Pelagibacterales bacterium]
MNKNIINNNVIVFRILTSIILGTTGVIAIIYEGPLLLIVVSLIVIFMTVEWVQITEVKLNKALFIFKICYNLICVFLTFYKIYFLALFFLPFFASIIFSLNKTSKINFTYVFIGPLYICIPILLLYKIRLEHENGLEILLWCVLITWTTDIFSFLGGKIFGGRKLLVSISPNKTWSGFITGIFAAMIFSFMSFKIIGLDTTYVLLWSFLLALSVQVGDLFESFIKRKHEVTESGKILPGHGGMLDRMDGFQFCAFFLSITVVLI